MEFKLIQPPYHLKDHIRYFYTLQDVRESVVPKALGPLADGCPGMIFQPASAGIFHDQDNKVLPELFSYGQTIRRTAIFLTGKFKTTGVCFQPNGLKSIFGFNAQELKDSCLDMNSVLTGKDAFLTEQLLHADSSTEQIEILSSYLYSQVTKNVVNVDDAIQYALSLITMAKGKVSLRDIHRDLNVSERTFERKFNQIVGISPKLYSQVCRFQSSLNQLRNNQYDNLSDVAFDNGYADQSHFIRVFKEFAGFSPFQFQKRSTSMMESFPVLLR